MSGAALAKLAKLGKVGGMSTVDDYSDSKGGGRAWPFWVISNPWERDRIKSREIKPARHAFLPEVSVVCRKPS